MLCCRRYKESQGVSGGNPICEPVFVKGAEPGDTLQVEVLKLRTADFGWTCVRPGGTLLDAPTRETLGYDPIYDDPDAPEDGIDAPRVFIWYCDTQHSRLNMPALKIV